MKNYNTRIIKARKSYSTEELADLLGAHIQTVRQWRRNGMQSIGGIRPYLFMGKEIKEFLQGRRKKIKRKLRVKEFYCFSCRKPVQPQDFQTIDRGITIGQNHKSLSLKANCPVCGNKLRKFSSSQIMDKVKSERTSGEDKKQTLTNKSSKKNKPETIDDNYTMFGTTEPPGIN